MADSSGISGMAGGMGGGGGGGGGSWGDMLSIGGMQEQDISNFIGTFMEDPILEQGVTTAKADAAAGYGTAINGLQPYTEMGKQGMQMLSNIGPFQAPTAANLQNDPGYQFRVNQGNAGINASAFGRGLGLSSGTAAALANFNQQMASEEYQNAYTRALDTYKTNYNAGLGEAGLGYRASSDIGGLQVDLGISNANYDTQLANTKAGFWSALTSDANVMGSHLQQIGSGQFGPQDNTNTAMAPDKSLGVGQSSSGQGGGMLDNSSWSQYSQGGSVPLSRVGNSGGMLDNSSWAGYAPDQSNYGGQ